MSHTPRSTPAWHLIICLTIISLATAIAHWPALHAKAISFDDDKYLTGNRLVQHPGSTSLGRFVTEVLEPSTVPGYYQPLTMISLMADHALGGRSDNLLPFHRTSLILHIANACLVVILLYRLFGNLAVAGCIGLLFGVHPMTVETIPWIGERKTLLATFFTLIALLSYIRYVHFQFPISNCRLPNQTERVQSEIGIRKSTIVRTKTWYAVCILSFLLALLSKPTSVPLPLCLLLLDYWPLRRLSKRAFIEKLPFLAIMLIFAYITYESQRRTAAAINPTEWHDPWRIPLVICHNIVFYLRKIIWPTHLTSHYPIPDPMNLSQPDVLTGVIGTVALLAALLISWRWTRACITGWLYFFVAIFPTLGIVGFTNVITSDKYAYLPSIGLMLPLAYGLTLFIDRNRARLAGALAGTAVLTGLAIAGTRSYLTKWQDTETLYNYMLAYAPNDPIIHTNLGVELERQMRTSEALMHYQRAVELWPNHEGDYYNIGNLMLQSGDITKAITLFKKAIELNPRLAAAYNGLGNAQLKINQPDEAVKNYQRAIEISPEYADARYNLANVLVAQNRLKEAAALYEQALAIESEHAAAHKNLAGVYVQLQDWPRVVEHYTQALKYRPDWWDVASALAMLHATQTDPRIHNPQKAVLIAEQAVRQTNRQQPVALGTLAIAYAESGRLDLAQKTADEAVQLAITTGQQPLADDIRVRMQKYKRP